MSKSTHSLADLYDLSVTRLFLTGPQAILRMVLMQSERDRQAGLDTAGYVSGYRGSPVGTVDNQFVAARKVLEPRHIVFQPGLNEDLAATACWGTQQAEMRGEGRHDGVFAVWYGKGPGVDRTGDVFRHANMAGTSPHGGVLAIAGDDHSGESSTVVHASDVALMDALIPVLSPAGVQEIIDYGLLGFAMSRHAGVWMGLKCVHDTVESSAVVEAGPDRAAFVTPAEPPPPPGGLSIRPSDDRIVQEERLHMHKIPAVKAFARANGLNRIVLRGGEVPTLGIVAAGKAWLDVRQALDDLGIDEVRASRLGIRLLKIGMVWPLEETVVKDFARGLSTIMVVEEKRALVEAQLRDILYAEANRPSVIGKRDEQGNTLFAPHGVLEPNQIALAIAARIEDRTTRDCAAALQDQSTARNQADLVARVPYFCAGCPHNSSTVLPEGARGYAGIGCHWLAQFVPGRKTEGATHMGGEGANWVGEAPFSKRGHVFQNIGDGTYNHSGLMAIRHAVGTGTNITYKILFNDAVAMTGGQRNDGGLTVEQIAQQMQAIGVKRIAVVSDEPDKYPARSAFPPFTSFNHRSELQAVQTELMGVKGTSVLIYDQTCAAEKRRRRRKGEFPDPQKRVFINELVCEGCGDCGVQSNCVAIQPVETEFGRKRKIDQSSCNKDFSCLKGFCPSFVTVEGGTLVKGSSGPAIDAEKVPFPPVPEPALPALEKPWSILVTGIGGTGVVTIGHLLGMAAHIEGKGAALIDMVGISQKNGTVVTHIKIGASPEAISAVRVARGHADLILGCDLVTSASERILAAASRTKTHAVINSHEVMPAHFTHDANFDVQGAALTLRIAAAVKQGGLSAIDATDIATKLMGDSIAANLFTLGFAWQKGLVPLSREAIEEAVELNGVSVKMNLAAFAWGRRAAVDEAAVRAVIGAKLEKKAETLDEVIARRVDFLTAYQDAAYAAQYRDVVARVRAVSEPLALAVARNLFKLMAYKDEYEVARLYTDGSFAERLAKQFTGNYRLTFHLAPPIRGRVDGFSGKPVKSDYGPWMMGAFRLLARMKRLRGTSLDIFGRTAERRMERRLIADYRALVERLIGNPGLAHSNTALELANLPDMIRGFGHVKDANVAKAKAREAELLAMLDGEPVRRAAE
ncbi:indolepyruvate ferredoxin oxidoreductase family protein [Aestuariivirga litoralis]|uniref:Indolepyruvate ferredoxin oxidoreductase family protein n=1 Tax=Aestuariivirga litoralis TaxID=2650924 RepID=A0A2W2AUA3_9HYPH|nr:indolepyruvate ferredoxin oxidoreductase family protein [Aestuariivirga litoralis]PZF78835.1 indolepyruvate ferredoxin oxidoreductase family protein [Aestuariivirga litoralis]